MRWIALASVAGLSIVVIAALVSFSEGERARGERAELRRLHAELDAEVHALRTALAELERDGPRDASSLQVIERRPAREAGAPARDGDLGSAYASDGDVERAWRDGLVRRFAGLDAEGREDALGDLAELAREGDEEALGLILSSLHDQAADVREEALEALQEISDPSLVEQIVPLARDPNAAVREEALEALRGMPPDRAGPIVAAALADEDRDVVLEALDSLSRIDYPAAVPSIVELTRGEDLELATHAAAALRRMGQTDLMIEALDRLAMDLFDPDALVRINAIQRVRRVGGDASRAYLERVMNEDANVSVRLEAQRALERLR